MDNNIIEQIFELVLPYIIGILEIMGIIVVCKSGICAFWQYIQNAIFHKENNLQFDFATGLTTALEFKMAAEILKTVLIRELSELFVLGAVIILRAILSILMHFEMRHNNKLKEKN